MDISYQVGVVVIGRNEGERLTQCILSALIETRWVVYVDSGSTDNSVASAKDLGAEVVPLDMSKPFTAARARNAGFAKLLTLHPVDYIQFVDGDCELISGWITSAARYLEQHQQIAVVCGRRRERNPNTSIYNHLCDIEWNTPIGDALACGGDAMFRTKALKHVDGFNPKLIAGEEPELCTRLRSEGWHIMRLNHEMTWHDAAILHFPQWWKRSKRAGHAFAQVSDMHPNFWQKERRSAQLWAGWIPLTLIILSVMQPWLLTLWSLFPIQILRIALKEKSISQKFKVRLQYAFFVTMAKFPELTGQIVYFSNKLRDKRATLIEYK